METPNTVRNMKVIKVLPTTTLQNASPETRSDPTENAVTSTEKLKLVTTHKSRVTTRVTQIVTAQTVTAVTVVTAVTTMTE